MGGTNECHETTPLVNCKGQLNDYRQFEVQVDGNTENTGQQSRSKGIKHSA